MWQEEDGSTLVKEGVADGVVLDDPHDLATSNLIAGGTTHSKTRTLPPTMHCNTKEGGEEVEANTLSQHKKPAESAEMR